MTYTQKVLHTFARGGSWSWNLLFFVYHTREEHASCHGQEMAQIKAWGDKWDFTCLCDFNPERLLHIGSQWNSSSRDRVNRCELLHLSMQPHCLFVSFPQHKLLTNYKCPEISLCKGNKFHQSSRYEVLKMQSPSIRGSAWHSWTEALREGRDGN